MYSLLIIAKKYVFGISSDHLCMFFFLKYQQNIVLGIPQEAFHVICPSKNYLRMME